MEGPGPFIIYLLLRKCFPLMAWLFSYLKCPLSHRSPPPLGYMLFGFYSATNLEYVGVSCANQLYDPYYKPTNKKYITKNMCVVCFASILITGQPGPDQMTEIGTSCHNVWQVMRKGKNTL